MPHQNSRIQVTFHLILQHYKRRCIVSSIPVCLYLILGKSPPLCSLRPRGPSGHIFHLEDQRAFSHGVVSFFPSIQHIIHFVQIDLLYLYSSSVPIRSRLHGEKVLFLSTDRLFRCARVSSGWCCALKMTTTGVEEGSCQGFLQWYRQRRQRCIIIIIM